jgi:pimeloyl-ACP methyl ester carboxylesterase
MFSDVLCVIVAGMNRTRRRETAMSNQRTHYVTTSDRVIIGGTVHGQGPPLVLIQGAVGDGDIDWNRVVEHLAGQFTCHLPSLRGRGLSGDHSDLSPGRQAHDILTYIDSVGEPIGLVGWSGGANRALAAAAQSDAVAAVAPYEPGILSLMDEQLQAVVGDAIARAGELATDGKLAAAVRAFLSGPFFNDEESAVAEDAGYFEAAGRYVTNLLNLLQQDMEHGDPAADPTMLDAISAPVMVLLGSDTKHFFTASAQHVADHVPNSRIQEIPGAGHAAPLTHPEALAEALTEFFSPAQQPA